MNEDTQTIREVPKNSRESRDCYYTYEKPCDFIERTGLEPGPHDCHICAVFQVSDVLISIWSLLEDRNKEVNKDD